MKTETEFSKSAQEWTKIHLSLTGSRAGMILCGITELPPTEKSFHAAFAPDECFTHPRICPDCLKLWNDVD